MWLNYVKLCNQICKVKPCKARLWHVHVHFGSRRQESPSARKFGQKINEDLWLEKRPPQRGTTYTRVRTKNQSGTVYSHVLANGNPLTNAAGFASAKDFCLLKGLTVVIEILFTDGYSLAFDEFSVQHTHIYRFSDGHSRCRYCTYSWVDAWTMKPWILCSWWHTI